MRDLHERKLAGMESKSITYRVIRSDRRSVAIQISSDGEVLVRCPRRLSTDAVHAFVQSKAGWIEKHLEKQTAASRLPTLSAEDIHALTEQARGVIPERAAFFARRMGVTYGRITIRNQRTRWGSCSGKGNLNFNCLLMLAPAEVLDYIVVHELCHRKEMNHSKKFWAEVEHILPDYKTSQKWLKDNGPGLISRMRPYGTSKGRTLE